jgi:glycosyltransferase involved in cell wall biosynthesis
VGTVNKTLLEKKLDNPIEVTFIVIAFNERNGIVDCISSILNQEINKSMVNIAVLVIDDGSNDGTQEILKKYADKYKKIIKIILSNEKTKNATNLLIKANIDCDSKYFCHFDGDDYWIDNYFLQKKIKILNRDEKIIGCSSITKIIREPDLLKPPSLNQL